MVRQVRVRRVYDQPPPEAGVRILVDRLWPRGLRKDTAALDAWDKDVAPSPELRRWFGHAPERFAEFAERYRAELDSPAGRQALTRLRERAGDGPVTLLTATKDVHHSHAAVLADVLRESS